MHREGEEGNRKSSTLQFFICRDPDIHSQLSPKVSVILIALIPFISHYHYGWDQIPKKKKLYTNVNRKGIKYQIQYCYDGPTDLHVYENWYTCSIQVLPRATKNVLTKSHFKFTIELTHKNEDHGDSEGQVCRGKWEFSKAVHLMEIYGTDFALSYDRKGREIAVSLASALPKSGSYLPLH